MSPNNSIGSQGVAATTGVPDAARLKSMFDAHKRWVESGGGEGTLAVFRGLDLTKADLSGQQLSHADFSKTRMRAANLRGADLEDADFTGADLTGAELRGADLKRSALRDANLRDTNMSDADLTGARGLLAGQLGGANLAGTKLPDDVSKFEGLANVAEASKTTQNLFFSILFVCAYTWLTIASTRDAQLVNNAAPPSSRLPILGTDIPLVQFYLVAPLLLLCLFVYFHLCLQRLWEELGDLPAVFPDGRPLDKKAYPWLLNVLVRTHAPRLKGQRTYLTYCQTFISIFLAWGLVPITVVVLWARYLRAHDWLVTSIHIALLAFAFGAALGFRRLAAASLRGSERKPFQWKRAWRDARSRAFFVGGGVVLLLVILSFGAIEGHNPANPGVDVPATSLLGSFDPRYWLPKLFQFVGFNPFAQLEDASLSIKPDGWAGGQTEKELDAVRGADLEARNLRFAQAYGVFGVKAFMKHADLREADLRAGDFRDADMREARMNRANLRDANLKNADLRWADLTETRFKNAKLAGARFVEANAAKANFEGADLTGAEFTAANLQGAQFQGALLSNTNLAGANLTGAVGLTQEQLAGAKIDEKTLLPESLTSLTRVSDARIEPTPAR